MIPVHEPEISETDIEAIVAALRRGEISGSFGNTIPEFERRFAEFCGADYGVAVSNGTAALHLAVAAAGIGPGDEVLVSASTNIASALAVYHNGAVPIPVDSEPVTWNMNVDLIESLITPRTRGIIPVHLFGHPVEMDRLMTVARQHNLLVIEDCAQSHGAKWRGGITGSFGDMGCFSFYANKIITTGEGGMVVTDDQAVADRLRLLRNLAFAKPRFRHELAGFNFRMTGYQAAMGLSQLQRIGQFIEAKRRVAGWYRAELSDLAMLQLPGELPEAFNVYWMYAVVIKPSAPISRDELQARLGRAGIDTRTFFCPMSQQPCLRNQTGFSDIVCPVADDLWKRGLYLPSSTNLTKELVGQICRAIRSALV
jgi:perosamine synthetase